MGHIARNQIDRASTHTFEMGVPGFDDPISFVVEVTCGGRLFDGTPEYGASAPYDCSLGHFVIDADSLFVRTMNPEKPFQSVSQYISDHVLDMFWDRISEERE